MGVGASLLANPTVSREVPTLGTVRKNREQARSYRPGAGEQLQQSLISRAQAS